MSKHKISNIATIKKRKATRSCCRALCKILFSHVGLVCLVCTYVIAGGFLFQLLEYHTRNQICQEASNIERKLVSEYAKDLFNFIYFNATDPKIIADNETQNDFTQLILPSHIINDVIRHIIEDFRDDVLVMYNNYKYYGQDCDDDPAWSVLSSLLFSLTLITTIGYGHVAPESWEGQIVCICYSIVGIPLFLLCIANISSALGNGFRYIYSGITKLLCFKCKKNSSKLSDWSTINEKSKQMDKFSEHRDKVNVPLAVAVIMIAGYLISGAYLFNFLENWQVVGAGYFSFVTISTIGFGDFVPGIRSASEKQKINLAICSVYVIFGIAMLAMCFDLIQEGMVTKFKLITRLFGFKQNDDFKVNTNAIYTLNTNEHNISTIGLNTNVSHNVNVYKYLFPIQKKAANKIGFSSIASAKVLTSRAIKLRKQRVFNLENKNKEAKINRRQAISNNTSFESSLTSATIITNISKHNTNSLTNVSC